VEVTYPVPEGTDLHDNGIKVGMNSSHVPCINWPYYTK
jgi:hypothetical protein